MATAGVTQARPQAPAAPCGFAALAESAWMGSMQAPGMLEPLHVARPSFRGRLAGLLTRELSIPEASLVLMASFFFSALLGAVRQILFNAQFGAGADASAFYAAIRLPDTLFSLIAGGALSSAMIPVLLSATREEGADAARRLTGLVMTTLLAAFAVLVLVGELIAPAFVSHILAPGFNASTSSVTTGLTRLMLAQPVILAVGSVATAVLNSQSRFLLTALSVASHNLGLIAGIVATMVVPGLGIYGPALGVLAGAVLQVVILLPGLRGTGFGGALDFGDRHLRQVIGLLIPNGLAVGVGYGGFILDTAFASRAPQAGALPALHNAFLLVALPIALLGQAVGQSAFPRLAAAAASAAWISMRATLLRALGVVAALAVPAAAGLAILGRPAIRVLFEHGKFGSATGSLTFRVLVVYAVALPAYVATEVLIRGLIALRDTRTPLLTNSVQVAGRGLIMAALLPSRGLLAVPIAFAIMATVETLTLGGVLLAKLQRRIRLAVS